VGQGSFEVVRKLLQLSYCAEFLTSLPRITERRKARTFLLHSNHTSTSVDPNIYGNPATLNEREILVTQAVHYIHVYVYNVRPHLLLAERPNQQNRGETEFYKTSPMKHDVKALCRQGFSAFNRNEYQECFFEDEGGRCVLLTTVPPSSAD
jgi:hypothetical protein